MCITPSIIQSIAQNNYVATDIDPTLVKIVQEWFVSKRKDVLVRNARGLFLHAIKHVLPETPVCLEVGTRFGVNAERMYNILKPSKVFLLDQKPKLFSPNRPIPNIKQALQLNKCEVITGLSNDTSWVPNDLLFDYVYIDACHSHPYVEQDIQAWFPLVKPGGVIAGHDYHRNFPDVIEAVNEFYKNNINQLKVFPYKFNYTKMKHTLDDAATCREEWAFIKV